jgi:hypothetical protein
MVKKVVALTLRRNNGAEPTGWYRRGFMTETALS